MTSFEIPPHLLSVHDDLILAARAAAAAGSIIRQGAGQLHAIQSKGAGDLVSAIDRQADQAATAVIRAASEVPILSEELSPELPQQADSLWIIDPLDATSAYLHGVGNQFPAVLIARYQQGRVALGVALFPLTGEWFYALRGRGAWKNGHRLCVDDDASTLGEAWVELNQYGDAAYETEFFSILRQRLRSAEGARLVTCGVPNAGVAMRIAEGGHLFAAVHDNNPAHVKQGPWDIAAAQVILEEAGGTLLTSSGEPVDPFRAEPFIVARSRRLAQQILDLAREASTVPSARGG